MNIKTIEELDKLYYNVFYGNSASETFTYKNVEYTILFEYGKKLPKIQYGKGMGESYNLCNMRKVMKGLEPRYPVVPSHKYMYR